jgi:HEAT repeat protein
VKTKAGGERLANGHEYAHLMLQRAEMARKEFVQNFGDKIVIKKPICIFMPTKERDAGTIQATYFGSPNTNLLYGGGDDSKLCGGFAASGFCTSEQKNSADQQLFASMRHMIGHSLISVWVVGGGQNRELPRWMFEGVAHWLCKYEPRFRDSGVWCGDEGTPKTSSTKDWETDCMRMAGDPSLEPIEKLFGKTAIGQLQPDPDQKRAWSYFDLCLREWREPFVAMLADLRRQREIRDAFMENLKCTPEIFNERWKERLTGRRRSMGPQADEDEVEGNDAPGARERRGLKSEQDFATLAAKVRALGTVDSPKTVNVLLDVMAKNSELVRETVMVCLLKMKEEKCTERIVSYGLSHSESIVRACAARVCAKLGLVDAVPKLREMLTEERNWLARAEAAVACGVLKDVKAMAPLRKIVSSDPAEKTQLAAMDALAMFGEDAGMSVPILVKQLDSSQWQLRVAACQALGQIGSMEAVEPLVAKMEQEQGRVREEIRDALKVISRDDLGIKPENWRKWWDREKANSPNGLPKRPDPPKEDKKPKVDPNKRYAEGPRYYGIEIYSSRIGFVLDSSLSMADRFEPDPGQATALSRQYAGSNKLDICKEEISQTLHSLDPRSHFSIIVFNTRIMYFKKNPVPSTAGNVASADGWLRSLPPAGETNYYGGLRAALDLDDGAFDDTPQFHATPDTLTFLTDGMPTQGEITDADVLLEWYTALNRYARIRTHVIAFGTKGVDDKMLRQMAERNGGRFVQVAEKN